jgi:anti-anti-sigma factor
MVCPTGAEGADGARLSGSSRRCSGANPAGATQPPGQNSAEVDVTGSTAVPAGDIKNGNVTTTTRTDAPVTPIPGAPDCPNPQWTENITDVAFTSATLRLFQDANANGLFEDSELVLTVNCTFSPPTSNGSVPGSGFTCTTAWRGPLQRSARGTQVPLAGHRRFGDCRRRRSIRPVGRRADARTVPRFRPIGGPSSAWPTQTAGRPSASPVRLTAWSRGATVAPRTRRVPWAGGSLSDDVDPSLSDALYVEVNYDGAATIVVVGEFDMTGTARFWASVSEALATHPPSITVEARGLTFIDSSGLAALLRAHEAADEAGVAFGIREPSPPLRRVAELHGVEDLLPDE